MSGKKTYGKAMLAGWLAILGNIFLFAIKLWAGIVSGSVALMADAWHTLSDSATSIVLIVFYKAANKPPDISHPYGHGRFRLIASIIIGVILFIIGVKFGAEAVERLNTRESTSFGTLAIVVTIISLLVKEGMARYSLYVSRKLDSLSLKADAWHHRSDAISSFIILVGIFLSKYAWWIDGVLGIMVALVIFYTAWEIVKNAIDVILGKKPDGDLIKKVQDIANDVAGYDVLSHHFKMHSYGDHHELTFHIVMPGDIPLKKAHETMCEIREALREKANIEPTIQIDAK